MTRMMMTGPVAAGMAAGTGIPRVTRRPHIAVGRSVAVRAAGIATMTTTMAAVVCPGGTMTAVSLVRGLVTMTTMTIGAAAADTAVGTAIRKDIPRRRAAAAGRPSI
jgi:hypothetical protein